MIRRVSLLSGFAAVALLLAGGLGQASAGELKVKPVFAPFHAPTVQTNLSPTTQHVTNSATAFRGPALSSADANNLQIQSNAKLGFGRNTFQLNAAPTTQSVTSNAFSRGGPALSSASAENTIIQNNLGGRVQTNLAPTTQNVHANAVAIGGPAISSSTASNVVSQSNVK
jgi:hypothetical protein